MSTISFRSIKNAIYVPMEIICEESGASQTVKAHVDAKSFRAFWPVADNLAWDPDACKFAPLYRAHFMAKTVKDTDRALLAFAAGQYYLRNKQAAESQESDADLHALELSALRAELRRAKVAKQQLVRENTRLVDRLQNFVAREDKVAEQNRQLQLRIQDLEAELASQKALREELDKSLDGSIKNANSQHKTACDAMEQLTKARKEADFYRLGMQKVAAIANAKPSEDH